MEQTLVKIQHRALDQCLDYFNLISCWLGEHQNPDAQVQDVMVEVFAALGYAEEEIPQQARNWTWDEVLLLIDRFEGALVDGLCRIATTLADKQALIVLAKAYPYLTDYKRCEKIKSTMKKIAFEYIANIVRAYVQVAPICSIKSIYFSLDEGGYIRIAEQPSPAVAAKLIDYPALEITVGQPHYYSDVYLPIPYNYHAIEELEQELNRELKKFATPPDEVWYEEKLT